MPHDTWWAKGGEGNVDSDFIEVGDNVRAKKSRVLRRAAIISAALCVALLTGATYVISSGKDVTALEGTGLGRLASTQAILSHCGSLYSFYESDKEAMSQSGVFDVDKLPAAEGDTPRVPVIKSRLVPPYGYMYDRGLDDHITFYDQSQEVPLPQTLNSMWSGTIVVWYSPTVPTGDVENIRAWAETQDDVKVVMWRNVNLGAPSSVAEISMPRERAVSFSGWGTSQSCKYWNPTAADEFVAFAKKQQKKFGHDTSSEHPKAKLDDSGRLLDFVPPTR